MPKMVKKFADMATKEGDDMTETYKDQDSSYTYEKVHYSLSEIARIMKKPRTTLKEWSDLFKEYLPTTGHGRAMRYRKEAIELFQLIAKMKESNEPNEEIRNQLGQIVKEIVITEEDESQKPYMVDVFDGIKRMAQRYGELSEKYDELSEDVADMKEMITQMAVTIQTIANTDIRGEIQNIHQTVNEKMVSIEKKVEDYNQTMKESTEQVQSSVTELQKEQKEMAQEVIGTLSRVQTEKEKKKEKKGIFGWFG
ncbi:MerR family transcriptional regulator [Neobacillus sp. YIM B02564]|uniref:MerR family transcriptional regulator n=1 Tax=Neobacillus paridis TaxID=2803862 RepID=A0ABS1TN67_9BACI|nr:MerR family transcriptional regulator [Neobacillus paridis]MBL4952169.1 MerR family transcriptional regulator [Neobacillus paridis]